MKPSISRRMVHRALAEDVGREDITTRLCVDPELRCDVRLVAKSDGVVSGATPFWMVFDPLHADVEIAQPMVDATVFAAGDTIAAFTGIAAPILTGERTALNFLQHLSGVASLTRRFVDVVAGTNVRITDTRKTTPLFRELEKEAVVHGGGYNHRRALYDGILIKENHIAAAGGIATAIEKARTGAHHLMRIEIEVTSLGECDEAIAAGADVILLDNMDTDTLRAAIARGSDRGILFEASGNVRLDTVRAIAETGVDVISIGALTHSAPAADLSLQISMSD